MFCSQRLTVTTAGQRNQIKIVLNRSHHFLLKTITNESDASDLNVLSMHAMLIIDILGAQVSEVEKTVPGIILRFWYRYPTRDTGVTRVCGAFWRFIMAGKIKYKQDLPPPGGYGLIPYLKNLPRRGPSGFVLAGMVVAAGFMSFRTVRKSIKVYRLEVKEAAEREMIYYPLLEVERDRHILREYKQTMESEALNIVGTGRDPDYMPGQDVWEIKRWREPYKPSYAQFWPNAIRFWYEDVWGRSVPGP